MSFGRDFIALLRGSPANRRNAAASPSGRSPNEPQRCPMCFGTGRGRMGGPCRYCEGRGWATGLQATGARLSALGGAIMALVFGGLALVALLVFIVAVIRG